MTTASPHAARAGASGLTLRFKIAPPGFVDVSLLMAKEWTTAACRHARRPAMKRTSVAYPMLHAAWRVPFAIGGVLSVSKASWPTPSARARDYTGRPVGEEVLMRMAC